MLQTDFKWNPFKKLYVYTEVALMGLAVWAKDN